MWRLLALRTGRGASRLLLCTAKVGRARSATHAADRLKCRTLLIGSVVPWVRVFTEWKSHWIAEFNAGYDVMLLNGGTMFVDKHLLCTFVSLHHTVASLRVVFRRPIPQEFCLFCSHNFHCLCNLKSRPWMCVCVCVCAHLLNIHAPPLDSSSHREIRCGLLWLSAVFF